MIIIVLIIFVILYVKFRSEKKIYYVKDDKVSHYPNEGYDARKVYLVDGPAEVTSSFIGFAIPTTKQLKYATITSGDALNGSFGKSNGVNNDCVIQSALGTAASFTQSIYVETKSEGYKGGINNVTSNSFDVFLQKTSLGTSMSMSFDIQE